MTTPKFKVGDNVSLKDVAENHPGPGAPSYLSLGESYVVEKTWVNSEGDYFVGLHGYPNQPYTGDRFELADGAPRQVPLSAVLAVVAEIQREYDNPAVDKRPMLNVVQSDLERIHTDIRKLFGHDPDAK